MVVEQTRRNFVAESQRFEQETGQTSTSSYYSTSEATHRCAMILISLLPEHILHVSDTLDAPIVAFTQQALAAGVDQGFR